MMPVSTTLEHDVTALRTRLERRPRVRLALAWSRRPWRRS